MKDREPRIENKEELLDLRISCYAYNPKLGLIQFALDDGLYANNDMSPIQEKIHYFSDSLGFIFIPEAGVLTRVNFKNVEDPDLDIFNKMQATNRDFFHSDFDEDEEFADLPVLLPDRAQDANWFDWDLQKWATYLIHTQYKKYNGYESPLYEDLLVRFAKQRILHPNADWVAKRSAIGEMFSLWKQRWLFNEEPESGSLDRLEEAWGENQNKGYAVIGSGISFRSSERRVTHLVHEHSLSAAEILSSHDKALVVQSVILDVVNGNSNLLSLSDYTTKHLYSLTEALNIPGETMLGTHKYYHPGKHDEYHEYSLPFSQSDENASSWINLNWRKNELINLTYFFSPRSHRYTIDDWEYPQAEYEESLGIVGRAAPEYLPERKMLLQFFLSQEILSDDTLLELGNFNEKKFLVNRRREVINGYEYLLLSLNSSALIESLKRRQSQTKGKWSKLKAVTLIGLEKQKDKHFGIVNLGQHNILGTMYHIYTGVEAVNTFQ